MAEKINEKLDRGTIWEERFWATECPKCKTMIRITDDPADETQIYCAQCDTLFELEG